MRHYLTINLASQTVSRTALDGDDLVNIGRCYIAKTLLTGGVATSDPWDVDANPLIFSVGPFAGTNFSNANRTSVGCKSPLTGGIKEANAGGSFGMALGQLQIAGLTLHRGCSDWTIVRLTKDGAVEFHSAQPYLHLGNFDCAKKLHEAYGKKVSIALCGPVGEYLGLVAGIAMSDSDRRPSRLAARGGVGAVMGAKKVKAIVADFDRLPPLHDRKKVLQSVKHYGQMIRNDEVTKIYRDIGTSTMADFMNYIGGLPVHNFSSGQQVKSGERLRLGGDHIREIILERGGQTHHACMPGCLIECSNVYVGPDGHEITSPIEYETIGLMGTNCGLSDPDDLAKVNQIANNLGIDTIETGAMIGVLMSQGVGDFGDVSFMIRVLDAMRHGSEHGRFYASGTARVGEQLRAKNIPVIKKQAISAYDPRVIEATGITMMLTAQGADHTAGNVPRMQTDNKTVDELVDASMQAQVLMAAADSLGFCIFGRNVTNSQLPMIATAINAATGSNLDASFFETLGKATLRYENEFNRLAGFGVDDDELPQFFYTEGLPPSNRVARFHGREVRESVDRWWSQQSP